MNINNNDDVFILNLKYFFELAQKHQKEGKFRKADLAKGIDVTSTTITAWFNNRRKPTKTNLRRAAEYFSKKFNIDYDLFENGLALKQKDFSKIIDKQEQSLHLSGPPTTYKPKELGESYDIQPYIEPELSAFEKNLPYYLRCINGGKLSDETIERLLRYIELTGIDSEAEINLTQALESMRRYPPHAGPGRRKYREMDNQDDEK